MIDSPPGTGDEPLTVAQTIPDALAVIVTTPQDISLADVRKSINFCRQVNMNILGLVENMSGYTCPHCGQETALFKKGGGEKTARQMNVPFLGSLPIDIRLMEAEDEGRAYLTHQPDAPFKESLDGILNRILQSIGPVQETRTIETKEKELTMPEKPDYANGPENRHPFGRGDALQPFRSLRAVCFNRFTREKYHSKSIGHPSSP